MGIFMSNLVRVCMMQVGIFYWFMCIDINFMFSSKFYVVQVFVYYELIVVLFFVDNVVFIDVFDVIIVGYVICFNLVYI